MSVLVNEKSKVLIQGITGKIGRFSARDLLDYGTSLVAGVVPTREGGEVEGVPIFRTVAEARSATSADCSLVYVPASSALDAVIEAAEAGCRLIVYPGDGLPVRDAIEMRSAARANGAVVVGPNTPGLISPGKAKLGFMPSFCYLPGSLGVISRSGSLSYEVVHRLTTAGLGQSTVIGIGGDPVKGLSAKEAVELFHGDLQTKAIVYLGEIGGNDEYDIAAYARTAKAKPVASLIVGRSAPAGKKMGHAAALVNSHADTHEAKVAALRAAGAHVAVELIGIVEAARSALERAVESGVGSRTR